MKNRGIELIARGLILKTTTAAIGANWVNVGNANATALTATTGEMDQVSIYNGTGTTLSFGYGVSGDAAPTGETFEVPTGTAFGFRGVRHANQLFVQRADLSNTQVTFKSVGERA